MSIFDRFIRYLCIVGVVFAAFYFILPKLTQSFITAYGAIIGPIIVVALFLVAWLRKPRSKQ